MNNISKFSISIIIFLFVSIPQMAGQDSIAILSGSWSKLKTQLQRRTDITSNLALVFSKNKKPDKDLVEKLRSTSTDLSLFIDSSKNLDSLAVRATYQKNNNLTAAWSRVLNKLISDTEFKSSDEARNLQMHLEIIENKMRYATLEHNNNCMKYKRPDLVFDKARENEK
jgi:hypothetical protein